jgi:tetratricopeptide (TPR) repeat protein
MHPIAPAYRSAGLKSFIQKDSFFPKLELPMPCGHKRGMEAQKFRGSKGLWSILVPLLLWLPSLFLGGAYLAYQENPIFVGKILAVVEQIFGMGKSLFLFGVLPLGLLALLLYPPFLPWLRLSWERFRKKGQFDRKLASDLLTRLKNFESVPDLLQLGRIYLNSQQFGMALPLLMRALEKEPNSIRAHFLLAQTFYEAGRPVEALPHAMATVHLQEDDFGKAQSRLLLAKVLESLGKPEEALAQIEVLHQDSGENYESLYLQAHLLKQLKRSEESRETFSKILTLAQNQKRRSPKQDWILAKAKMALLLKNGTVMREDQ